MPGEWVEYPFTLFVCDYYFAGRSLHGGEFHVSRTGFPTINDIHFKSGKERTKSRALPLFDSEIAVRGAMVTILAGPYGRRAHLSRAGEECVHGIRDPFDFSFYVGATVDMLVSMLTLNRVDMKSAIVSRYSFPGSQNIVPCSGKDEQCFRLVCCGE